MRAFEMTKMLLVVGMPVVSGIISTNGFLYIVR